MEDLEHPGYLDFGHPDFENYLDQRRNGRSFEDFTPFITTEGLDSREADQFQQFLKSFFDKTKKEWEPGGCRNIPELVEIANQIASEQKAFNDSKFVAKRFSRGHYWIQIEQDDGQIIIVDPSGIPKDPQNYDRKHILPYFGPLDSAPEYAKKIYETAEDMDDWGTRDLPPSFHP